jgi:hypothetical protein
MSVRSLDFGVWVCGTYIPASVHPPDWRRQLCDVCTDEQVYARWVWMRNSVFHLEVWKSEFAFRVLDWRVWVCGIYIGYTYNIYTYIYIHIHKYIYIYIYIYIYLPLFILLTGVANCVTCAPMSKFTRGECQKFDFRFEFLCLDFGFRVFRDLNSSFGSFWVLSLGVWDIPPSLHPSHWRRELRHVCTHEQIHARYVCITWNSEFRFWVRISGVWILSFWILGLISVFESWISPTTVFPSALGCVLTFLSLSSMLRFGVRS